MQFRNWGVATTSLGSYYRIRLNDHHIPYREVFDHVFSIMKEAIYQFFLL